jgi:hypothetical protein
MEPNLSTVRARRAQIAKLRKVLDTEDQELEIAETVLVRLSAHSIADTVPNIPQTNGTTTVTQQPVTQKDLVIGTLRARIEPWVDSSRDLQAEIERTHGVLIRDSSLLPLLTTLKGDGIIRRDAQNRIALTERANVGLGVSPAGTEFRSGVAPSAETLGDILERTMAPSDKKSGHGG